MNCRCGTSVWVYHTGSHPMSDTVLMPDLTAGLDATAAPTFLEFPLISDVLPAAKTDPNVVNAWGISFPPTGPFWISDQGSGKTSVDSITGSTITTNVIPAVSVPSPT